MSEMREYEKWCEAGEPTMTEKEFQKKIEALKDYVALNFMKRGAWYTTRESSLNDLLSCAFHESFLREIELKETS